VVVDDDNFGWGVGFGGGLVGPGYAILVSGGVVYARCVR
jgi:hypothetical protein